MFGITNLLTFSLCYFVENKYLSRMCIRTRLLNVIIIKITLYAPLQHSNTLNTDCVQMLLSPTLTDTGFIYICMHKHST